MNDYFFSSAFLEAGSAGAEPVYNEHLLRTAAAFGRVLSRTTTTPPGSPSTGDAYYVPLGASGAWIPYEQQLVIWASGWKPMILRSGMRFLIEDEDCVVEVRGPGNIAAIDGHQTLTAQLISGTYRVAWDCAKGTSAQVTLAQNSVLMAPSNMVAGRMYALLVRQDATGSRTLSFNAAAYYTPAGAHPVLTTTANAIDILLFWKPNTMFVQPVFAGIYKNLQSSP